MENSLFFFLMNLVSLDNPEQICLKKKNGIYFVKTESIEQNGPE